MSKRTIILLIFLVVIVILGTLFYLKRFYESEIKKEVRGFGEDIIYQCTEDRDCVSVEIGGCCPNKTSINKRYQSYWYNKEEMLKALNPYPKVCPTVPCPIPQSGNPQCVNNSCELADD